MVKNIIANVNEVIVGKEEITKLLLTCMISCGHVLLEDLPGSGKTKLSKALSKSLSMSFSRIQFTPDLLPTDVTGLNVYNKEKNEFILRKGPVFTNILLADEINRATPRTQAGLLECMEEHQVTIDGETLTLEEPFFVMATQNPIETTGTFPLPEAQLDRFLMKLSMGPLSYEEELDVMNRYMKEDPITSLKPVASAEDILKLREKAKSIYMSEDIKKYILNIVSETRKHPKVLAGVSVRGTLALMNAVKAYALIDGRDYCIPDDVNALSIPVLSHRLVLSYHHGNFEEAKGVISYILKTLNKPTENFKA